MDERRFWAEIRRGLLIMSAAIAARYTFSANDCEQYASGAATGRAAERAPDTPQPIPAYRR